MTPSSVRILAAFSRLHRLYLSIVEDSCFPYEYYPPRHQTLMTCWVLAMTIVRRPTMVRAR